ncbi:CBASS cGAMP-activated phospholipase [Pyxidicoccus caerfyrddinensis]|uniref:CBASS cGAMP-activated phospholipase n=2 Tax=Myxococcaceae TaxID=31 RepID=UPI0013DC3EEB|nr:CBASS cGAMP-activated phospholipase [Pyxidicoccus caerfyrddinensis]
MDASPRTILALDGGGIRGILTAACLAYVEEHLQIRIVKHLRLLTGTSTGAIIALALASGMSAKEALEAYKTAGPLIFGRGRGWFSRLFRTAHDNTQLIHWLQRTFQEKTLNDACVPIAIPTLEALTGRTRVWKDNHHPDLREGGKKMWEVALASAAAPTYLPAVQIEGLGTYLDGGLWANNPSVVGLIEARRYLGADFPSTRLLSIGTGRRKRHFRYQDIRNRGRLRWAPDVIEVVLAAQADAAHEQARLLIGPERYLRIDEPLPGDIALDDLREAGTLEHLGREAGMRHLRDVERLFLARE